MLLGSICLNILLLASPENVYTCQRKKKSQTASSLSNSSSSLPTPAFRRVSCILDDASSCCETAKKYHSPAIEGLSLVCYVLCLREYMCSSSSTICSKQIFDSHHLNLLEYFVTTFVLSTTNHITWQS